jgi:thiol-disulfide isomerase/thioredoxin/DNA-binding beta-propeller fold protein YncE
MEPRHANQILVGILALAALVIVYFLSGSGGDPEKIRKIAEPASIPYQQTVAAADFTGAKGWLNVAQPISLADLKGKIVLLDFWTYCCINCMHVIPDLKQLEAKYPKELVVIGIHSAKFQNEKETENIGNAIRRYGIGHPVANDSALEIWHAYDIHAWPTLVLIDPEGFIVGKVSGEGNYDMLDRSIAKLAEEFRAKGKLSEQPIAKLQQAAAPNAKSPLLFPGKVLADTASKRLFIADSNHHRIVVTDLGGKVRAVIGSGKQGLQDGDFKTAEFNGPQGMALKGHLLYVADTLNHALRQIDLTAKTVTTLAGSGKQARGRSEGGVGREIDLNSPWDVIAVENRLFIAMAGSHQIWSYDLSSGRAQPFAGNGRENIQDGSAQEASLAQPSGLATDGQNLYVADAEVSALRSVSMESGGVQTLIGKGLFDFGDQDGPFAEARLQHPLAVTWDGAKLLVADTYNHRIKVIDLGKKTIVGVFGTGKPGKEDGRNASFNEPGGLSVAGGKLYVADTNNHVIRVADLKMGKVRTLKLTGL